MENYPVNDPREELEDTNDEQQANYARDYDDDHTVEPWERDEAANHNGMGYDSESELQAAQYLEELEKSGLAERGRNDDPINDAGLLHELQAQNHELQAEVRAAVGTHAA